MTGYKESLGTYLHLTRKELQKFCKIHKLPANRSHYDLAKSLASFLKKKNSSFGGIGEETASQGTCSEIINLDEKRENAEIRHDNKTPSNILTESSKEEIDIDMTINGMIDNLQSSTSDPNPIGQTLKSQTPSKTLDSVLKLGLESNTYKPSIKPSFEKPVPSFHFFVYSEEGINICIDLNSNPSEWVDNLKDDICINASNKPCSIGSLDKCNNNSLSSALNENFQSETIQNPNSLFESRFATQIEEKGEENQDNNTNNINNNDTNTNNNDNEVCEVSMENGDLEGGGTHLSVACSNFEKLMREKLMSEKIDPLSDEQSVIVLDSSSDQELIVSSSDALEGDVTLLKANDSSELSDGNQALDKNSK